MSIEDRTQAGQSWSPRPKQSTPPVQSTRMGSARARTTRSSKPILGGSELMRSACNGWPSGV